MEVNEIMKLCDNALDLGDTENIPDLLELLRSMLEHVYDYERGYTYDPTTTLDRILDVVEDF